MHVSPRLFLVLLLAFALALCFVVLRKERPAIQVPHDGAGVDLAAVEYRGGLPQGHVYCGITDEPECVNPFTAHGTTVRRYVLGLTHEGLLDTDPATGQLRPALAERWHLDEARGTCTFTLRAGVQFADGSPVTMADVLFGWELAKAGHLQFGFVGDAFGRVAEATALDDRRLEVRWQGVHYAALRAVGEAWLVTSRTYFEARVRQLAERLGQPVPDLASPAFAQLLKHLDRDAGPGTGPFQLPSSDGEPTTWRRRQDLLLTRNPHHWRRAVEPGTWNLAGVRLLFRDRSVAHAELHGRNVDWFYDPDGEALLARHPDLQADYRTVVYDHPTQGVLCLLWNCQRAPLGDARVRRALGHLFDRAAMVQLYHGKALPAVALAKPTAAEYPAFAPLPFDPSTTRRLLREAGIDPATGSPLRLQVLMASGDPQVSHVLALLVAAAREAGVEIVPRELEFGAFVAQKQRNEWDGLLVLRSFRAFGDPYEFVHRAGSDNDGHYASAEVDRLASAARSELDEGRRTALLRQLHDLVHQEQPLALLVHPLVAMLFNKHIQAAEPGPRGLWPERFWVAPEHQRR